MLVLEEEPLLFIEQQADQDAQIDARLNETLNVQLLIDMLHRLHLHL